MLSEDVKYSLEKRALCFLLPSRTATFCVRNPNCWAASHYSGANKTKSLWPLKCILCVIKISATNQICSGQNQMPPCDSSIFQMTNWIISQLPLELHDFLSIQSVEFFWDPIDNVLYYCKEISFSAYDFPDIFLTVMFLFTNYWLGYIVATFQRVILVSMNCICVIAWTIWLQYRFRCHSCCRRGHWICEPLTNMKHDQYMQHTDGSDVCYLGWKYASEITCLLRFADWGSRPGVVPTRSIQTNTFGSFVRNFH